MKQNPLTALIGALILMTTAILIVKYSGFTPLRAVEYLISFNIFLTVYYSILNFGDKNE